MSSFEKTPCIALGVQAGYGEDKDDNRFPMKIDLYPYGNPRAKTEPSKAFSYKLYNKLKGVLGHREAINAAKVPLDSPHLKAKKKRQETAA